MTLRSPAFEQALGRRVRQEVNANPLLHAEHRRHRQRWHDRHLPLWAGKGFIAIAVTGAWASAMQEGGHVQVGLAFLALWSLVNLANQAARLAGTLFASPQTAALFLLPLADPEIFRVQARQFVRQSLTFVLLHVPAGAFLAYTVAPGWGATLAALVLPPLQAVLFLAVAVHLEARWPGGWHRHLGKLWLLLLLVPLGGKYLSTAVPALVQVGWWIPPSGWLNYAFYHGAVLGDGWAWTLLVPVALPLWTLPWAWRRLQRQYHLAEPNWALISTEGRWQAAEEDAEPPLASMGRTELEEAVREGGWRAPLDWSQCGWLERLAAAWFSPRERLAAEFMTAGRPNWSSHWRGAGLTTVFALVVLALLGQYGGWLVFLAGVLVLAAGTPLLGGTWRGFEMLATGGMSAPLYAAYPLGYWDIARMMLKVNWLRCVLAAPLVVVVGMVAGWKLAPEVAWPAALFSGGLVALKILGLVFALQPAAVVLRIAGGTNDTQRLPWRWSIGLIPILAALLAFGVFVFLGEAWWVPWACLGGVAVTATFLLWLYGVGWARGKFDLVQARSSGDADGTV